MPNLRKGASKRSKARVTFGAIGVAQQIVVGEHFDEELKRLVPAKQAGAAAADVRDNVIALRSAR